MKTFTRDDLKALMALQDGWCVSLYLPTHRDASQTQQDPIRLKNLLREAGDRLNRNGLSLGAARALLDPAHQLVTDNELWRQPDEGLALFISAGTMRVYQVPLPVEEAVVVAQRFMVRPLLPLLRTNERFYVLALSQNDTRLLSGSRFEVSDVEVEGMPHSMAEAMRFDELEKQSQYHSISPSAGRGPYAIFHGQGLGTSVEKDRLLRYFHQIDHALHRALEHEHAPLVIAAVDYLMPIYREINSYPHLMADTIHGNPELLSAEELRRAAWPIVEPEFSNAQAEALAKFRRFEETARASTDLSEIVRAAHQGRIESLFVATGMQRWGSYDPARDEVQVHPEPKPDDEDLVDLAATQALLSGGAVYALPSAQMPANLPVVAVFRD